jgi:hypothetical protein
VERAERELEEEGGSGAGRGCSKMERPESSERSEEEAGMVEICTLKSWGGKG